MFNAYECVECGKPVSERLYLHSEKKFGLPLCEDHEQWLTQSGATSETITLYFALKTNKVPVLLEYWDGKRSIDIAVPGKLYIEVDKRYDEETDLALSSFLKTLRSSREEIQTIKISPCLMTHRYEFNIAVTHLIELWLDCKQTG